MTTLRLILGSTALCLLAAPAAAVPADFRKKAEAYLKSAYPADGPGAAVIVVENGKVVYQGAQGLADLETKRKITPATVFRLGSNTKQFTATVILQLVEEGKISLDDRLSKFLPDYPKPGADATVRQLLTHTSGIKNFTAIPRWMMSGGRAKPITTEQLIAVFKDEPADFAPGAKYQYNNSGYALLGAIIEKVTGKPWHVAVQERIAKPNGLSSIRYGVEESTIAEMASGYAEQGGKVVPASPLHMSSPHAAGSLVGSVGDFARWARVLHKGKVLKPGSYRQMTTANRLADGTVTRYGFGLGLGELRGRGTIGHAGETSGFYTATTYIPSEDLFLAVFTNSIDPVIPPDVAISKLAGLAVGEPYPEFEETAFNLADVEPFLGVYKVDGGERRFFAKDGKLFTRRTNGDDQPVFAAGNGRFFYGPATLTWFEVKRGADGTPVMTSYQGRNQEQEMAARSGPIPAEALASVPRQLLEAYVGHYRTERGVMKVALSDTGTLSVQLGGSQPRQLSAKSETEFGIEGMDATLTFGGSQGAASTCRLPPGIARASRRTDTGRELSARAGREVRQAPELAPSGGPL